MGGVVESDDDDLVEDGECLCQQERGPASVMLQVLQAAAAAEMTEII